VIFAIAGTQLPFPRLMNALDGMADHLDRRIMAQTADPAFSSSRMQTQAFLGGAEFNAAFARSRTIVAHAGIGVIMGAAELGKPIIIMPRRADLGEHRNDHQIATARRFASVPGITVVLDADELEQALLTGNPQPVTLGSRDQLATLIAAVSRAIG
jgi:UDP-N-acetylglucosamine transferase subunit ALG13